MLSLVHSLSTFNILAVASAGCCIQRRRDADSKDLDLPIMGRACGTRNTTLGASLHSLLRPSATGGRGEPLFLAAGKMIFAASLLRRPEQKLK